MTKVETLKPTVHVERMTFSGGQTIEFNKDDKILIVGPNNCGKSQTIGDLASQIRDNSPTTMARCKVIKTLSLQTFGSQNDLQSYLAENATFSEGQYQLGNASIHPNELPLWESPNNRGLRTISNGFIKHIGTLDRLNICKLQNSVGISEQKSLPQQLLYDSNELMDRISQLFFRAFSQHLQIDFRGGSKIPIHVCLTQVSVPEHDRVSDQHVNELRLNPLLHEQGDGMQSYAGILFQSLITKMSVTMIDEPEAFLHPPQMRQLGNTLASEVQGQLFVATHSSDIMRGFLEGAKGNVRIVRLRRDGNLNYFDEASNDAIAKLWNSPVLRYSNALEAVFHQQTIICEADGDSRLYNAVADHLVSKGTIALIDTAYVPANGKNQVPIIAKTLRKVGVPIKAVFDHDFLRDQKLVQDTFEAFGGDWNDISALWTSLKNAVESDVKSPNDEAVGQEIIATVNINPQKLDRKAIGALLKPKNFWQKVKENGATGVPSGQATKNHSKLIKKLEDHGIYLVPSGEVESFAKEIDGHGPDFVTKLLAEHDLNDEKFETLPRFVEKIQTGKSAKPIINENQH